MSLATRCTGCGTVFRVVQDQLRVSAGWVRCGRCGTVFNAIESLVDVVSDAPGDAGRQASRERVADDLRRLAGQPAPDAAASPLPEATAAAPDAGAAARDAGAAARVDRPADAGGGREPAPRADWPARVGPSPVAPAGDGAVVPAVSPAVAPTVDAASPPPGGAGAVGHGLDEAPAPQVEPPWPRAEDHGGHGIGHDGAHDATQTLTQPRDQDEPHAAGAARTSWEREPEPRSAHASEGPLEAPLEEAQDGPPAPLEETDAAAPAQSPGDGTATAHAPAKRVRRAQPAAASASEPQPAFVRRAERAARWRRPGVRAALVGLALVGAGGLAVQAALLQHDLLAARWPAAAPALARLCAWAGCTIEPPRRVDGLALLSSTLVRDGAPGRYRLGVTMRNREPIEVRMPAFELTLSDAQGRLLVRRVLRADELGVSADRLGAGAELALEAVVLAGAEPVVGYTIELFYP